MSRKSDRPEDLNKKPRAEGAEPEPANRPRDAGYEVGYGKPPKHGRFAKGQSGNPRGRPRKAKPQPLKLSDAPSDGFLEAEAYRSIALRENGQGIELPAIQAVLRAAVANAIKGNRLAQKYVLEYVARIEEHHFQIKMDHYRRLRDLKRDGEQALAECEEQGLPPPDLLPHPEDIVLNSATGEAWVNGPETTEDVHFYEHSVQLRNLALLHSAHYNPCRGKTTKRQDDSVCAFLVFAQFLDRNLPCRYRWQGNDELFLMMEYHNLTRRERERLLAAGIAHLKATQPRLSLITPEMDEGLDRIIHRFVKKRGDRPAELPGTQGDG